MLRIAVCDDISAYVERLAVCIEAWAGQTHFNVQLKKFASGEDVLLDVEEAGDFTAVFMDIELSGIDGMETAARIRERNRLVSIVFVSQYEQYFKETFQFYPCQYIEKPVARQKVFEVLDRIVREHRLFYESLIFRSNRITFNIALYKVLYFASDKRMIKVFMEGGREYSFYKKLNVLEEELIAYNNRFIRIHQSYLVNCKLIEQYHPDHVVMQNGDIIPVSRNRRSTVMSLHLELLSGK